MQRRVCTARKHWVEIAYGGIAYPCRPTQLLYHVWVSGTDLGYAATPLPAMCGTDLGYAATSGV
eukprot:3047765-Rhodomonas_salina.1